MNCKMRGVWAALAVLPGIAAAAPAPTPVGIVAAAPAGAWSTIPAGQLMLVDLGGASHRRVTIQLAPEFAPVHVANIRRLIAARAFEHTGVARVQDDYVVQWGDAARPPPAGLVAHPPAEYERTLRGLAVTPLPMPDAYAPAVGFALGWPIGIDRAAGSAWLAHCYGMVGVGRDMPPDTGSGAELYAVIGQAPRQLDRNIALVGRIIDGIDALDTLPRGSAALGFYAQASERTPILRVRLASELPPGERPQWQVMRTGTPAFSAYVQARANRRDPFYVRPAGGVDLCNVPLPVRRMNF